MKTDRRIPRVALFAGGAAVAAMAALTAGCGSSTTEQPPTTTPATTGASTPAPAPMSPTEKAVRPGDNSFTPSINPTPPNAVCKEIVGGVCVR